MYIENSLCCPPPSVTKTTSYSYSRTTIHQFQRQLDNVAASMPSDSHASQQGSSTLSNFMSQLPDIRALLKPWFFRDAANHNFNVARQFAMDIVNHPNWNGATSHHVVMRQVQYEFHIIDDHQCLAKNNQPVGLLSDSDRCMLEQIHQSLKEFGRDVQTASQIASKLVFQRMGEGQAGTTPLTVSELLKEVRNLVDLDDPQAEKLEHQLHDCVEQPEKTIMS